LTKKVNCQIKKIVKREGLRDVVPEFKELENILLNYQDLLLYLKRESDGKFTLQEPERAYDLLKEALVRIGKEVVDRRANTTISFEEESEEEPLLEKEEITAE